MMKHYTINVLTFILFLACLAKTCEGAPWKKTGPHGEAFDQFKTLSQDGRRLLAEHIMPRNLFNSISAAALIQDVRAMTGTASQMTQYDAVRDGSYPEEGYPDLFGPLPPRDQLSRQTVLMHLSHRIRSMKADGWSTRDVIRALQNPVGEGARPETVYAIDYDEASDDGWVALKINGIPYQGLDPTQTVYKTPQWVVSIMVLPLRPVYNVVGLKGQDGMDRIESLERFVTSLQENAALMKQVLSDTENDLNKAVEKAFEAGHLSADGRQEMLQKVKLDMEEFASQPRHMFEILHYPGPYNELPQMHPKIGLRGSETYAYDIHSLKMIPQDKLKLAIAFLDALPKTFMDYEHLQEDYLKYTGRKEGFPAALEFEAPWTEESVNQVLYESPIAYGAHGYRPIDDPYISSVFHSIKRQLFAKLQKAFK